VDLLLTGFYKGTFLQVLPYTWFYKSENFCAYAKSNFRMKSTESFIHEEE